MHCYFIHLLIFKGFINIFSFKYIKFITSYFIHLLYPAVLNNYNLITRLINHHLTLKNYIYSIEFFKGFYHTECTYILSRAAHLTNSYFHAQGIFPIHTFTRSSSILATKYSFITLLSLSPAQSNSPLKPSILLQPDFTT